MLTVRVTRGDSSDAIACVRADGTSTWERRKPGFGVAHDLTHLAVESVLGIERGFFGLVDAGWNIETFSQPGAARRLPVEAVWVEDVVSGLQSDTWGTGARDVATFNESLTMTARGHGMDVVRQLTEAELGAIRRCLSAVLRDWDGLAPGKSAAWQFAPGISAPPTRCPFTP